MDAISRGRAARSGRTHVLSVSVASALALALLLSAGTSTAVTSTNFNFSGFLLPDDDSGVMPDVDATFTWDETCVSGCTIRIDLNYNDSNSGSGLTANPQGYAGVTWDMLGGAVLRDNTNQTGASVVAPTLVGLQVGTAAGELTDVTVDGVSGEEVTRHWAVRNDLNTVSASLGTNVLSSVGDITSPNPFWLDGMGFIGVDHLLPDGALSTVEDPPNGIPFAIVDPFTTMLTGLAGDVVLAQSTTAAFLLYDGTLSGIENVSPLFGTDGVAIPEPTTAVLLGLGLVGLAARRRSV